MSGTVRIGVSGWRYEGWLKDYYPEGLRQKDELAYLSRRLSSVEVNGSFYSLQRASTWLAWKAATPRGFRFAVKGSRFISHNLKLGHARQALANFLASGPLALGEKLGPVLWQLPLRQRFLPERLTEFLALLPRDTHAALALAREHDARVKEPWLGEDGAPGPRRRIRWALEPRHPTFFCDEAYALLRRHDVAFAHSDAPGWALPTAATASFIYIRFHGATHLYHSRYEDAELEAWAERIVAWARSDTARTRPCDVYAYFDNDARGHAPWDAERLVARISRLHDE